MSLQPTNRPVERDAIAPFLLRVYWQQNREPMPTDFSVAPPADTTDISDYSSLLPLAIRQKSVIIYSWSDCSLAELTGLLTSMLPAGVLPSPAVGTRLVYKLVFPDTRAEVREGGKGKWVDKPLGSVVVGGNEAHFNGDEDANGGAVTENLGGETGRTLGDARFVIGDYVVCTIYPPGQDGRIAAMPPSRAPPRMDPYAARGPPPPRENGYGSGFGRGGGYRGGYVGRGGGGFGAAPPVGDWRRGERPPPGSNGGGYGRGRGGRPY
ncbi:hypothetical protein LTR91_020198 [Friedmanniomyces endolithicus]|uniref:Histone deacetylase complex subunit SAP18 n=1 Tax=Friedmanniomyces endolithicus TaxID=329885 RepID=A0AAN6K1A9_9PEZI|nr:hypothetical protein LTR94_019469 [Friedmanniomyces endolithicus]KAK0774445.1 hypothetical protein LTR59_014884 [Friedmanniomyces endolithicus]KAK0802618.1 hypothetical protein LTR75_008189 [Friedmanniomyces endolithicus]KAK0807945.1 hypothetical protein LTR38_004762 [Friedmanniomyces endolithicus]KAK0834114.1 hypothetical protein LTR03_014577 [Friedmanniomyces endolithicus]